MAKVSNQPLQPNPFTTYRDPQTGIWKVVVKAVSPYEASQLAISKEVRNECQEGK